MTAEWRRRLPAALVQARRAAAWLALVPCAVLAACGAAAVGDTPGVAGRWATVAPGAWGQARQVPGTESMSQQAAGPAMVSTGIDSVACPARGDCAASGGYVDSGFNYLVFAASQRAGRWAKAVALPGDAALVGNGGAADGSQMDSGSDSAQVSCSSAGNCAVAGNYQDVQGFTHPLVASERGGVWGRVHPVSGQADAALVISCPPAVGNCAAGGIRERSIENQGAFVVSEKGGVWGSAQQVVGAESAVTTMSCPAAGSCLAGGGGGSPSGLSGFLVSERNGRWGPAGLVPGFSRLTWRGSAVESVACVAVGDCTVGGSYTDAAGRAQVFIAAERRGVWGPARPLPGLAALNQGGEAVVSQVSCTTVGSCAAGGWYSPRGSFQQAWVATEVHGQWREALQVPGTAALNTAGHANVGSVSCAAAECVAGGWYTTGKTQHTQAFLVNEQGGLWGTAEQVPGLAALNTGNNASVASVSCAPSGWCTAVGHYTDFKTREDRMFVVSQH